MHGFGLPPALSISYIWLIWLFVGWYFFSRVSSVEPGNELSNQLLPSKCPYLGLGFTDPFSSF